MNAGTRRPLACSWLRKVTKALRGALHDTQERATTRGVCRDVPSRGSTATFWSGSDNRATLFGPRAEHMNENLSRIFPKCLHSFIGAVQTRSVVQPQLRTESAR